MSERDATDLFEAFEAAMVEGAPTLSLQDGRIWIDGETAFDARALLSALSRRPDAPSADTGWMPKAVADACEVVRSDAANTMQHTTTADLSARLMCRVDARKLGLVLAWVDQFAARAAPPQADGGEG